MIVERRMFGYRGEAQAVGMVPTAADCGNLSQLTDMSTTFAAVTAKLGSFAGIFPSFLRQNHERTNGR
jgi:hypothetical protein